MLALLIAIAFQAFVFPVGAVQPLYSRNYVGRETVLSHVPVFVLYDPPGDNSYAEYSESRELESDLKYGAHFGFSVSGEETQTWTTSTSWATPDDERMHLVICMEVWQTWDVWCVITSWNIFYEAELVSSSYYTENAYRFDELDQYDIWVDNRIGDPGDWDEFVHLAKNSPRTDVYAYEVSSYAGVGAGYDINVKGIDFSVSVDYRSGTTTRWEVTYYQYNKQESLDYYQYSNFEPYWDDKEDETVSVDTCIWFSI